jgi:hypothetical protein
MVSTFPLCTWMRALIGRYSANYIGSLLILWTKPNMEVHQQLYVADSGDFCDALVSPGVRSLTLSVLLPQRELKHTSVINT